MLAKVEGIHNSKVQTLTKYQPHSQVNSAALRATWGVTLQMLGAAFG